MLGYSSENNRISNLWNPHEERRQNKQISNCDKEKEIKTKLGKSMRCTSLDRAARGSFSDKATLEHGPKEGEGIQMAWEETYCMQWGLAHGKVLG